jgi:hypothetical protein
MLAIHRSRCVGLVLSVPLRGTFISAAESFDRDSQTNSVQNPLERKRRRSLKVVGTRSG